MDAPELKAACLALPGAVEDFPFGDEVSVFKVAGKMFALSDLDGDPLQLSIKCEPELAGQLPGHRPRLPLEQAALEHGHPGRLAARPDGDRHARRLLRPGRCIPAAGPPARRVTPRCGRQSSRTPCRVAANS